MYNARRKFAFIVERRDALLINLFHFSYMISKTIKQSCPPRLIKQSSGKSYRQV